jgi:hypothetical protein
MLMLARTANLRRQSSEAAAPTPGYDSLTFRGVSNQASLATSVVTVSSADIGPANANRQVIVAVVDFSSSGLASCTIGGISATRITRGIYIATVPTGTTATITMNSSGANIIGAGIGWWTVNMPSPAAWAFSDITVSMDNFDIPANGFGLVWSIGDSTSDQSYSINQSFLKDNEGYNTQGYNFAFARREVTSAFLATVTGSWSAGNALHAWVSFAGGAGGGGLDFPLDPNAENWRAAAVANGGTVSTSRLNHNNNLIITLKSDGIWDKLDRLFVFAAENPGSAITDIRAAAGAILINGPSFSIDRGYTGNGGAAYIDTGFNPAIGTNKFLQNDAHWGHWNNSNNIDGQMYSGIDNASTGFQAFSGQLYLRINDGAGAIASTDPSGFWVASRLNSTGSSVYRNGPLSQNVTATSGAVANSTFWVLGAAGPIPKSISQCAAYSIGGGLTATEVGNFYTRLRTYLTAIGVP